MPVRKAKPSTKSRTKEDVSHKIQEIRQRQQNWLKQRDKSKEQEELSESSKISIVTESKHNNGTLQDDVQNSKNVARKAVKEPDKNNVRQKFKHWIDTRNPSCSHEENIPDFNDSNSILSGAESELERLVSPDQHSATQPVSEEEFRNLAEKIAHKVKEDLGLQHPNSPHSGTPTSRIRVNDNGKPVWSASRCKTFVREEPTFNNVATPTLSSHNCTVCKRLMLSAKNIPTMVIPCGHTFCKLCLEEKQTCPSCDCSILSLTVNIMLLQVIKEYHSNQTPSRIKESESLDAVQSSGANKYFQDNHGRHKTSYKAQLENLETRRNILFTEHKTLVYKQGQLVNRLLLEQKQTQNIKMQEEEVEKAISDLHEKLKVLQEHRKNYECQVMELQDKKSKLQGKITLLSTTTDSLTRDIEKVKLLSENEMRANTN